MTKMKLWVMAAIFLVSLPMVGESFVTTAKLAQATIYFQGAELIHNASVTLSRGENEVVIKGLSANVDKNSIRISTSNGVLVNSFEFSADYLTAIVASPYIKILQDSLNLCTEKVKDLDDNIVAINDGLDLLNKNKSISGPDKGVGLTNLVQVVDYFQTKTAALLKERRLANNKKEVLAKTISRLEWQINQEAGKNNKSTGMLKLQLMAPANTASKIEIVYYTQQAKWNPYYDINVLNINKPVVFATKAQISQTTGLDWEKVKLTLSTATPAYGQAAPTLDTWFLYATPQIRDLDMKVNDEVMYELTEMRSRKQSIPAAAPTAGSVVAQPLYIVNGNIVDADYAKSIDPQMIKNTQMLNESNAMAAYGSKASNGAIVITLKDSMEDYITQSDSDFDRTYDIDLPYSIQGNGKSQNISIQTQEIAGVFKYYAVPKLSLEAFLMVEIANWNKLNLMSGNANITYDGTYIGKTYINAQAMDEVLALTLGVDKRITVKCEKIQDSSIKKFLGNDIKQSFMYQITVKNNRTQPINMTIKEQLPVSTTKEIVVEILKDGLTPTTRTNNDTGILEWDFTLNQGETKTLRNSYSVKYPKEMDLNL